MTILSRKKNVTLSDQRKGEIALLLVKKKLADEGVRLQPDFIKNVARSAKEVGVPAEELTAFVEGLVREMVEEAFR